MAVSCTAFLAGIDAEIHRDHCNDCGKKQRSGAYRKCQIYTFGIVQICTNDLAYKMQCDSNSNKTGQNADWNADHTQTQCLKTYGMTDLFLVAPIDFSSPNCFVRSLTEIEKAL